MLVDTHCHIHEESYSDAEGAYARAIDAGVTSLYMIGTSVESSRQAIEFSRMHKGCFAVIGVHPHDAKDGIVGIGILLQERHEQVVGIGEIGLDYYYTHSPREVQIAALEQQLQWARDYNLPVSFHVREAFDDFWPVFDNFTGLRGVLHSYTDTAANMERALSRGLYFGINGISTFTKDTAQQAMFDAIPLESIVFETDAPFLTPTPKRGTVNEPAYVKYVAEYHANRRDIDFDGFATVTTTNASALFQR